MPSCLNLKLYRAKLKRKGIKSVQTEFQYFKLKEDVKKKDMITVSCQAGEGWETSKLIKSLSSLCFQFIRLFFDQLKNFLFRHFIVSFNLHPRFVNIVNMSFFGLISELEESILLSFISFPLLEPIINIEHHNCAFDPDPGEAVEETAAAESGGGGSETRDLHQD